MSKGGLFIIVLVFASCYERSKKSSEKQVVTTYKPHPAALALNNKATRLMGDAAHSYDSLKPQLYDSAIIYLSQAIEIDSLYVLAYNNKVDALRRKGSLGDALQVLEKIETIKPDFAGSIMAQGFILEKMNNSKLADQKYKRAYKALEKRLAEDPDNDKVQSDIAFLYMFLEDKNRAVDEIQNLILENPKSEQLKMMEGVIRNFDRKKFIEEY